MWNFRRNGGKYNARKTIIDGKKFDSSAEAIMYSQLKILENTGKIRLLSCQDEFTLQPGYTNSAGKKIQPIKYRSDFTFFDLMQNRFRVLDCKGMRTPVYNLKRKMFDFVNRDRGLTIEENI